MTDPFQSVEADLRAPLERDPAARGPLDVVLSYPGFHALLAHRFIHALHRAGVPLLPRFLSSHPFFYRYRDSPGREDRERRLHRPWYRAS